MGLYSGGLIIGRIFASEIWGAYFREGLFFFFFGGGGAYYQKEFYDMQISFLITKAYFFELPKNMPIWQLFFDVIQQTDSLCFIQFKITSLWLMMLILINPSVHLLSIILQNTSGAKNSIPPWLTKK